MSTKKTWISIVIASVIIVVMLAAVVVGGTAFFIYRHVHAEFTNQNTAEQEFSIARARFAHERPLIEIRKDEDPIVHRDLIPAVASHRRLESLRVLAYDDRAGKLVR